MDKKNIGTVSLEGYEAVRKEAFEGPDTWIRFDPSNGGRILFSESCVRLLRKPPYVQILVNPNVKRLILRGLWRKKDGKKRRIHTAVKVDYEGKTAAVQGTCGIFIKKLTEVMQWEPDMRYQIIGQKVTTESRSILSFPLELSIAKPVSGDPDEGTSTAAPVLSETSAEG